MVTPNMVNKPSPPLVVGQSHSDPPSHPHPDPVHQRATAWRRPGSSRPATTATAPFAPRRRPDLMGTVHSFGGRAWVERRAASRGGVKTALN